MVIIAKSTLTDYGDIHTSLAEPFNQWYAIASKAKWVVLLMLSNLLIALMQWVTTG